MELEVGLEPTTPALPWRCSAELSYSSGDPAMIDADMRRRRTVAAILAAFFLVACSPEPAPVEDGLPPGLPRGTLSIGDEVELDVAIAETLEDRTQGLMGVRDLEAGTGMVFLHEEEQLSGFWMKDTLLPLTLVVWGEDGRVGAVLDMVPCEADPCPTYNPGVPWIGALEVERGSLPDVQPGDPVRLER